ncbi:MAG: glycosyltransferase [Clostridia bacterium]|nr:glycosyltransferase [Clostridia bacterium]
MKKKILFAIPSLRSGGAEKSLISVLSLFDYDKYEVDLILFRREGLFFEKLPREINHIYDTTEFEIFDGDGKDAIAYFIKKFKFLAALDRVRYLKAFDEPDMITSEVMAWRYLKKRLPKTKKHYDCAIGYLEGNANDYVADCVKADRKICFIHNDIGVLPYSEELYKNAFEHSDAIVTVSEVCLDSLKAKFEEYKDKMHIIENITCRKIISDELTEEKMYSRETGETVILTVGRCSEQKNIELAVDACKELKKRNRNIKWYHIGKGMLENRIKKYVSEMNMENDFIMLGEKSNPYNYMAQCDIYVQPSLFEGKSIAIDEVKCLCKPIVVTDFPSVYDQIEDGVNGIICKMNKEDMADKIEMLIDNVAKREQLSSNLAAEKTGNEEELLKLYKLIDD